MQTAKLRLLALVETARKLKEMPNGTFRSAAVNNFFDSDIPTSGLSEDSRELSDEKVNGVRVRTFECHLDERIDGCDYSVTIVVSEEPDGTYLVKIEDDDFKDKEETVPI